MWITGEFQLPLNSVDLAGPVEEWKDLAAVDDGSNQYLGDLCLSLRYVPSSGKLTGIYKKIVEIYCRNGESIYDYWDMIFVS